MRATDEKLGALERLANASIPLPWRALVEGRDFPEGGDSFIQTGVKELQSLGTRKIRGSLRLSGLSALLSRTVGQ